MKKIPFYKLSNLFIYNILIDKLLKYKQTNNNNIKAYMQKSI